MDMIAYAVPASTMPLVSRFVLTHASGRQIRNPLDEDLQNALDEVLESQGAAIRQLKQGHAKLRLEQQTGTTVELEVCRNGDVMLHQWSSDVRTAAPSLPARLASVSFDHALAIWRALRAGDLSAVRHERWQTGS